MRRMTLIGFLTRREPGRIAVTFEMLLVCGVGSAALAHMLARAGLGSPYYAALPTMVTTTCIVFYTRALRVNLRAED